MAKDNIRVLLVEDDEEDYLYARHLLSEVRMHRYEVTWADRLEVSLNYLTGGGVVDVILLDLTLPDSYGLETFTAVRKQAPGVPIVLLTGLQDEDLGTRAVHAGAQDYLAKGELSAELLSRSINYAIERLLAQEALQSAYKDLESLINERTQELARTTQRLHIEVARRERLEHVLKEGRHIESLCAFVDSATHRFSGLLKGIRDGLRSLSGDAGVGDIMEAADTAESISSSLAGLTKAVGAGDSNPEKMSPSKVVRDVVERISPSLQQHDVSIEWTELGFIQSIYVDAPQFLEIASLFVTNAPLVLPEGGKVRLHLVECVGLPARLAGEGARPDDQFVVLEVFYSGVHLDASAVDTILNPIARLGADAEVAIPTGVGLAVVQSRSRGWGGNVQILPKSEHGGGFRVFLPVFRAITAERDAAGERVASKEPVLVVDDDQSCVVLTTEALAADGYGVVSATSGQDALALLSGQSDAPAAAVVDATLPGDMSKAILSALRAAERDVPVLMVSGFSRDYLHGILPRGSWHFLQKPFEAEDISSVIRELIRAHGHGV